MPTLNWIGKEAVVNHHLNDNVNSPVIREWLGKEGETLDRHDRCTA